MALHKTGFPKEEATSRNGYLIKAGSEPAEVILLFKFAHRSFIYNSNAFSTIGPPAGTENTLKLKW